MATLSEQQALYSDAGLLTKCAAACVNAALAIQSEAVTTANHTARVAWAKATFAAPSTAAAQILPYVVAANAGAASASISGASDATIQTAVNAAVNAFLS